MRQQQAGRLEPELVKSARAAMPSAWHMIRIDPRMVRFTQAECSPWFQRGGALLELFLAILADDSDSLVETVPPLQIVWAGRYWSSLGNRRLAVFKAIAIFTDLPDIPACALCAAPAISRQVLHTSGKWSTQCEGCTSRVRGERITIGSTLAECRWY